MDGHFAAGSNGRLQPILGNAGTPTIPRAIAPQTGRPFVFYDVSVAHPSNAERTVTCGKYRVTSSWDGTNEQVSYPVKRSSRFPVWTVQLPESEIQQPRCCLRDTTYLRWLGA